MSLTKLKLNESSVVIGMCWSNLETDKAGFTDNDGYTVYQFDQDEIDTCVVDHTRLIDGHLFTENITKPFEPSAEQQAITDLAISSAKYDQHIQSIEEAITSLAQTQMGGTNNV